MDVSTEHREEPPGAGFAVNEINMAVADGPVQNPGYDSDCAFGAVFRVDSCGGGITLRLKDGSVADLDKRGGHHRFE